MCLQLQHGRNKNHQIFRISVLQDILELLFIFDHAVLTVVLHTKGAHEFLEFHFFIVSFAHEAIDSGV